jgi:phytanoyl-CoA dioxygenase PhyH
VSAVADPTTLTGDQVAAFRRDGYVVVPGAFAAEDAARMRDVVWSALRDRGVDRDDPSTWHQRAADHLQHLKKDPAFRAVGSGTTLGAIADLLGEHWTGPPPDWGAFFLLFPGREEWFVPWKAWHVDHTWTDPVEPVRELKVHAMFGDVEPRAGGMPVVAGSHHVVDRVLRDDPPPPDARAAAIRAQVMRSCGYLRELGTDDRGDAEVRRSRIARFLDRDEEVLGHRLRVVEMTARAGDVILFHPLVLHTRPVNAGRRPRFLLNRDLYAKRPAASALSG